MKYLLLKGSSGKGLGIVKNKLEEFKLPWQADLRCVQAGDIIAVGKHFAVEFIRVNHSIADACALAISTPVERVFISPKTIPNQTVAEYVESLVKDIKNEDDVKSLSRVMVHVFSDGVTNGQDCDSYFFWCLCGQTLEGYKSRKLHRTTSRKHHRCCRKVKTRLDSQTERLGWVCGVLPRRGPRRRHQKCAAGFCRCCRSRSWFGISNKIAF